jgi:hypothetical protein
MNRQGRMHHRVEIGCNTISLSNMTRSVSEAGDHGAVMAAVKGIHMPRKALKNLVISRKVLPVARTFILGKPRLLIHSSNWTQ